ncbi:MAG TPA: hypothetical protein DCZ75_11565 [Geobacter sp.]|nr:hypothetical protein [Geobacter sp.]
MTTITPESFYIGWDVGGWNCDRNKESRDAIVILDLNLDVVGDPWRGNLRVDINKATTAEEWLSILFQRCKTVVPDGPKSVTMAIDTPLGFSEEFVSLVTKGMHAGDLDTTSGTNPYLFRYTERYLYQNGLRPLSAIKDMIGSQATKGMHVLAKFAPTLESCGVWTDGMGFRAIEAYPAACRESGVMKNLLQNCDLLKDDDRNDARVCAMIAHLFATDREQLVSPPVDVPVNEGWIWIP